MKKGWEIKKLGEVATIKGGKRVPKGYSLIKEKTPYPYIRVTDFTEEGTVSLDDIHYIEEEIFQQIKNYFITTNDLYISIAGTIGKTGIVPKELNGANLTENACRLIFNNGIYNRYVLYYTKSNDFIEQAGLNTRTTAMPKLALTRLSEIPISIPPLPEQQRIVSILDEAFAAIDQAKANVQKNLNNAKELFQSELNSVFSKKGDGWVEKKLGEVCEKIQIGPFGSQVHKEDYMETGIPIINPKHIKDFNLEPDEKISIEKVNTLPQYKLKKGDIIMGRRGEMGRVALIDEISDGWFCGTGSLIIRLGEKFNSFVRRV